MNKLSTLCTSTAHIVSPAPPRGICKETKGDTAASYCENLVLGRYRNWRLPNINELTSIIDRRMRNNNYLPAIFKYTTASQYWSSTTDSALRRKAYITHRNGHKMSAFKTMKFNIRCVHPLL